MSRTHAIALSTLAALSSAFISTARAGDLNPPPWPRNDPMATYQAWTFPAATAPAAADAGFNNAYGPPVMNLIGMPGWTATQDGHTGAWGLTSSQTGLDFHIPNHYDPTGLKQIWIQIKYWRTPGTNDGLDVGVLINSNQNPVYPTVPITTYPIAPAGSGWNQCVLSAELPNCPDFENIIIKPSISGPAGAVVYIDQVIIDTRCIPSPGSFALLSAAALFTPRRRRRA